MNNFNEHHDIEHLLTPLSRVSLSHTEKAKMREHLAQLPIPSPLARPVPTPFMFPFLHPIPSIAFLLILTITTSTVSAAEGALPGDILYPIKVKLNEEVRTSLTFSPEKKAAWEVERAERRIEEATLLAVEDTLDESVRNELEASAQAHIEKAEELSHTLEVSEDHEDALVDIEERVRLARHSKERILEERPVLAAADTMSAAMAFMAPPTSLPPEVPEVRTMRAMAKNDDSSEHASFARVAQVEDTTSLMTQEDIAIPDEPMLMAALPVREKAEQPQDATSSTTSDDEYTKKEKKRDEVRARTVRTVMDKRIKQAEEAVARATDRRSKESIDAAKERLEYAKKLQEEAHKDGQSLFISEEAAVEAVAVIERIVREEKVDRKHEEDREDETRE
jgi:hypothetical protein